MLIFGFIIYLGGLMNFCMYKKHVLMMMLSMEVMMLGVFSLMIVYMLSGYFYYIIFFMVIMVIEASMGLGLLVIIMIDGSLKMFSLKDLIKW
uniref:NADH dehydrogenase subunit 4L n=1 Tax=Uroobovella oviformis TaxID=3106009 RepID=UPI002E77C041|nr:NADH dehydrogenase subunit 4L [Uroobovella oviformis]WPV72080.1 NADH dehydrogenase subunit 4L [Uroobovella oviformis]